MIPLRSAKPVSRFPLGVLFLCLIWIVLYVFTRVLPDFRLWVENGVSWIPGGLFRRTQLLGVFFHLDIIHLLANVFFAWAFLPRLWERRGFFYLICLGEIGFLSALWAFSKIHSTSLVPILAPEAFLGTLLGAAMQSDIWENVETWVVGPGWIRVLEVPSYVLLFFWFFYLLLAKVFYPSPFTDAPMVYFLGLFSFLLGFVFEGAWKWVSKKP